MIIVTFPLASILIAVCTVIYLFLFKIFLTTLASSKRLELQTRTVLYNRFEELNSGLSTILAYDKSEQFTEVLNQKLEANISCNFMIYIGFKWLALRNEMISTVILIGTALFSIMKTNVDPGEAGLVCKHCIFFLIHALYSKLIISNFFFLQLISVYRYWECLWD